MSKYKAKKVVVNGITFDSSKEAKRYKALYEMEQGGEISDLQMQVKYVLIPAQREPDKIGPRGGVKKGKVIERECAYFADFVYIKDGSKVVEDIKGYKRGGAYALFTLKRKLMLHIYGIRVKEV